MATKKTKSAKTAVGPKLAKGVVKLNTRTGPIYARAAAVEGIILYNSPPIDRYYGYGQTKVAVVVGGQPIAVEADSTDDVARQLGWLKD